MGLLDREALPTLKIDQLNNEPIYITELTDKERNKFKEFLEDNCITEERIIQ